MSEVDGNKFETIINAEGDADGLIIQYWKQSEIERARIPLLPLPRQRAIATKVQSSFALRAESKRLLDLAKHAVEVAIEEGAEFPSPELLSSSQYTRAKG